MGGGIAFGKEINLKLDSRKIAVLEDLLKQCICPERRLRIRDCRTLSIMVEAKRNGNATKDKEKAKDSKRRSRSASSSSSSNSRSSSSSSGSGSSSSGSSSSSKSSSSSSSAASRRRSTSPKRGANRAGAPATTGGGRPGGTRRSRSRSPLRRGGGRGTGRRSPSPVRRRGASPPARRNRSPIRSRSPARRPKDTTVSSPPPANATAATDSKESKRLCVRNLSRNLTKEHLAEIFGIYGSLKNCEMPTDRVHSHLCKGYGYVEYEKLEDAEKAMKHMDGGRLMGGGGGRRDRSPPPSRPAASNRGGASPRRRSPPPRRRSPARTGANSIPIGGRHGSRNRSPRR
uniref:RRM domain-containing protein n=1 Tax=Ditylenchus dipsaci TaxID=166011 RepID=A0A915DNS8_9BILA